MMGTFIVTVTLPRLRFHDLRHSFASLLIAAGVELVKVSVLFGHSELRVTADLYSHLQQQTFAGCQTGCQLCSQRPGIPADPGSLSAPLTRELTNTLFLQPHHEVRRGGSEARRHCVERVAEFRNRRRHFRRRSRGKGFRDIAHYRARQEIWGQLDDSYAVIGVLHDV